MGLLILPQGWIKPPVPETKPLGAIILASAIEIPPVNEEIWITLATAAFSGMITYL